MGEAAFAEALMEAGMLWEGEEEWFLQHGDAADDMPTDCAAGPAWLDVLPETCTLEKMLSDDNGCSFQMDLTSVVGADLRVLGAVGKCPSSLMPFISVSLAGTAATDLLAPCATDSDCAAGQKCFDIPKVWFDVVVDPDEDDPSLVRTRSLPSHSSVTESADTARQECGWVMRRWRRAL